MLAPLTTFRIGGPARYFINAQNEGTVLEGIQWARDKNLPLFVLGGGSNLLVADAGFPGVVLKVGILGTEWTSKNGKTHVYAGAGEGWDGLVASAVQRDLAGTECLSGIPGLVGGTPVQNVGAYGQEVSEVLGSVRAYDIDRDCVTELSRHDCGFSYRTSIFNSVAKGRYVVLGVSFLLTKGGAPTVRYADVLREFEGKSGSPSLADVRAAVQRIRRRKAMLLIDGDPDSRSAGSFFKNPVITRQQLAQVESVAGEHVPQYPAGPGDPDKVKTAAAWLIERAGFQKGYSVGPVGLSTKHTLAVVNKGAATAEDVLRLAREIRSRVLDRFGIELMPEPVLLGFPDGVLL